MTSRPLEAELKSNYDNKLNYYSPADSRNMSLILNLVGSPTTGSFLDVGCGDGRAANWAELRRMQYVGMDYSEKRVEQARKVYGSVSSKFLVADVYEFLQSNNAKFDLVWCCEVLEHLEEPHLIWEGMKAALNPGGMVVATVPINMPYVNHLQVYKTKEELHQAFPGIDDTHVVRCQLPSKKHRKHFVFTYNKETP